MQNGERGHFEFSSSLYGARDVSIFKYGHFLLQKNWSEAQEIEAGYKGCFMLERRVGRCL